MDRQGPRLTRPGLGTGPAPAPWQLSGGAQEISRELGFEMTGQSAGGRLGRELHRLTSSADTRFNRGKGQGLHTPE